MSHEINMPFPVVRLRAACRIYWLRSNFVFTPFQIDLKIQGKNKTKTATRLFTDCSNISNS